MTTDALHEMNERFLAKLAELTGTHDFTILNDGDGLYCHIGTKGNVPVAEVDALGYAIWPILLREYSPHYTRVWYTLHPSLEAAAAYHDGQENPEDWGEYKAFSVQALATLTPNFTPTARLRGGRHAPHLQDPQVRERQEQVR
jgi:hypothetical protein